MGCLDATPLNACSRIAIGLALPDASNIHPGTNALNWPHFATAPLKTGMRAFKRALAKAVDE
jgi:hypothetical protein